MHKLVCCINSENQMKVSERSWKWFGRHWKTHTKRKAVEAAFRLVHVVSENTDSYQRLLCYHHPQPMPCDSRRSEQQMCPTKVLEPVCKVVIQPNLKCIPAILTPKANDKQRRSQWQLSLWLTGTCGYETPRSVRLLKTRLNAIERCIKPISANKYA